MRDLQSQLRCYVEETIERIDSDDVLASAADKSLGDEESSHRTAAFAVALIGVLVVVGGVAWLSRGEAPGPAVEPTVVVPTTAPGEANVGGLRWHLVAEAPDLDSVSSLVAGCCWNVALDSSSWVKGFGESFTGPGTQDVPSEIGPLRAIAVNGGEDVIAVPDVDPSPNPYVAVQQITGTSAASVWATAELPTDVPKPHPDVVMHYRVLSVVHSPPTFALYGWAQPELDPAAIEREYPELGAVVRTDLIAPCCEGEPLTTEIEDPLWVWTGQAAEPIAVSLGAFGLTKDDLRAATGVVWVIERLSAPAPWEATTAVTIDDVVPDEAFLSGGAGGLVLVASRATGEYETWTSTSGTEWSKAGGDLSSAIDTTMWDGRALVLTAQGTVLELEGETWVTLAGADTFDPPNGEPADPVRIEAGDLGVVVISDREQVLPWSGGEPVPTAQVLWFSSDGSTWSSQETKDVFGGVGAVELLVTAFGSNRAVPPVVLVAFGGDQDDGYRIDNPQWWVAQTE